LNTSEVLLLFVQIWRNVMAEKRKEGGDRKSFIAV